jgi:predicted dehydrogenase
MHPVTFSAEKLRFGLIGAGRIADSYRQAFESARNARLVAVADTREEAARQLAEATRCHAYTSYQDMLAGEELEAVVVATPPASHGPICLDLCEHRIPVLCEKPVSIDVETAEQIRDAAWRNRVLFTMASKFRYADDVIRAKSIVTSGILGDLVLFENTFMSRVDMKSRWNADPTLSGGGVLIDNGTHSVDIMRYFLGPLEEIYVVEGKRSQGLAVDETVRVLVRGSSGVIGSVDLSWSVNKETDHYIAIYGSHGTLRIGWKESTYRQAGSRDWIVFGKGYDKVGAFRRQIENFSAAILGQEALQINADDAVASVEAIQAGYASLRQRRWTSVAHIERESWNPVRVPAALGQTA